MNENRADVLRPAAGGLKAAIMSWGMEQLPLVFRILRALRPILRLGESGR